MLRHALGRTVAALTAIGTVSVLTVAGAASPAAAATVSWTAGYGAPVPTTASLTLARTVGQYGSVNVATVRVGSGVGAPTDGTVTVTVNGWSRSAGLNGGGLAQLQLPRTLAAQHTYTVTARYNGRERCQPSSATPKYYTVVKAGTDIRGLAAPDRRVGGRPSVTGRVTSYTGLTPAGTVQVRLFRSGHLKKSKTVSLRGGHFSASFGRISSVGTWTAKAVYVGTRNCRTATDADAFRVSRR